VKLAAAVALGKCTKDINSLVSVVKAAGTKVPYLYLRALREAIIAVSSEQTDVQPLFKQLLPELLNLTNEAEEQNYNVLAESLGEMSLREPEYVLGQIAAALKASTPKEVKKRTVLILAGKCTVTEQCQPRVEKALQEASSAFLGCLSKADSPSSRRAAVLLLTALGHRRPLLLHTEIGVAALKALYLETPVDENQLEKVDLGPFTHIVDKGIDLRKAVYECLDVLVDSAASAAQAPNPSLLVYVNNFAELVRTVAEGAKSDINGDIQQLCFGIFVKLSKLGVAFTAMLSELDKVASGLEVTLKKKPDNRATEADKQKFEEIVKNALRALKALCSIPSAQEFPSVAALITQVQSNEAQKSIYAVV